MNGRILIVDGTAANRIVSRARLADACYTPLQAADGRSALHMARAERPDLILLNLSLTDLPGETVIAGLRADPVCRHLPILALAAPGADEARVAALKAGADDVMARGMGEVALLARIRNLLRRHETAGMVASAWGPQAQTVLGLAEPATAFEPPGEIGLLSFRPETALLLKHRVQGRMRDQLRVLTREEALTLAPGRGNGAPEVIVIEAGCEGAGGGLHLMSQLATHPGTRHCAFCIVLPTLDDEMAAMAYDLDAGEVITPETPAPELALRLRALIRRKREADRLRSTVEDGLRLAMIDALTGTYNRRYAIPRLAGIADQATSEGSEFAVMVVDLDRFKSVNDRYGHAIGDLVLAEVARRLADSLRMSDLLARYGGEEFLIALPQTGLDDASRVAERLRRIIGDTPVCLPSGETLKVTISIGVAVISMTEGESGSVAGMIEQADHALLSSKTGGRNLVTFSPGLA